MNERTSPPSVRRVRLGVLGVVILALGLAGCGSGGSDSATKSSAPASVAPENVAFFYLPIRNKADVERLGPVRLVVAGQGNSRRGGADIVQMIHSTGAKAYIYQQTYWFPQEHGHQGLNMSRHPDWAFCSEGDEPVTATRKDEPWVFLDMNESRVQLFLENQFKELKAAGWDGIFFDRGGVALGALKQDPDIWHLQSTCTEKPVHPGAALADTWVDASGLVKTAGLDLIVNYGLSPFDPRSPMRADPQDPNCVERNDTCRRLSDGWKNPTWVLDEAISHPRDLQWDIDYQANLQNEKNKEHPHSVIGLITVGLLGGDLSRENVFYEWARVKLFDIPLGISVWDRAQACPDAGDGEACRSLVTYPELSSIRLGPPIDDLPRSDRCASDGPPHCVWSRRYEEGAMVVNVQDRPVSNSVLKLGTDGCRYVFDVWSGKWLAGHQCVEELKLDLPAWSGRPLKYSRSPG
jgi:hypothetical protein